MSSMKDAMKRAGFSKNENDLRVALALFRNRGGTLDRGQALLAEAFKEMPGEGQLGRASNGQSPSAPARQPNGDVEGHSNCASAGHSGSAPSSPPLREREGHSGIADKAPLGVPTPREPSHAQAGHKSNADKAVAPLPAAREPSKTEVASMGRARLMAARTVLDTFTITMRQGSKVPIGDIPVASYGRLLAAAGKRAWVSSREYNLLFLLKEAAGKQAHIPQGALTRDVFGPDAVKEQIDTATALALPKQAVAANA